MSVHKTPRRRGFGWQVRWRDERGRSRSQTFELKRDADHFDTGIRRAKQLGGLEQLDAGKSSLGDFGFVWWRSHVEPHLAGSTQDIYAHALDKHVLPRLGHYPLRKITPRVVSEFAGELHRDGVGPSMAHKSLSLLQQVMDHAVLRGEIQINPVKAIRKPKAGRLRSVEPLAPSAVEKLRAVLQPADATRVSVYAYSGLRPGEDLALTWGDVRPTCLRVNKALADGTVKGTKTGQTRTVSLLEPLRDDLAAWRRACQSPNAEALVFPNRAGTTWRGSDWNNWRNRVFRPAVEGAELPSTRPYDLRHSFASLLIHEGRLTIIEIAEQLGHKPTMCLDTYAHVMAELRNTPNVNAVEEILRARAAVHEKCMNLRSSPDSGASAGAKSGA